MIGITRDDSRNEYSVALGCMLSQLHRSLPDLVYQIHSTSWCRCRQCTYMHALILSVPTREHSIFVLLHCWHNVYCEMVKHCSVGMENGECANDSHVHSVTLYHLVNVQCRCRRWAFGSALEDTLRPRMLLLLYGASGIAGAVAYAVGTTLTGSLSWSSSNQGDLLRWSNSIADDAHRRCSTRACLCATRCDGLCPARVCAQPVHKADHIRTGTWVSGSGWWTRVGVDACCVVGCACGDVRCVVGCTCVDVRCVVCYTC